MQQHKPKYTAAQR